MTNILVIGESPDQSSALAERLGTFDLDPIPCARDWKLAVRSLTSYRVSLVLLAVDGSEESAAFFQTLKDLTDVPIIALGRGKDSSEVMWYFDHGAVDYITASAPAGVLVGKLSLLARVESAGRDDPVIRVGDLEIDPHRYVVTLGRKPVPLTPIEFKLLRVLAENVGRACSRQMLLERVWGRDFKDCAHYLRLYIGYLRQKLEASPGRPRLLLTEWGYGYRLVEPERALRRAKPVRRTASAT